MMAMDPIDNSSRSDPAGAIVNSPAEIRGPIRTPQLQLLGSGSPPEPTEPPGGSVVVSVSDAYRAYADAKGETDETKLAYLERIRKACEKGAGWNRKPAGKRVVRERPEQIRLAEFLDWVCMPLVVDLGLDPELCPGWCHVPNERDGKPQHMASLARQGVKRGVSDCLIWVVPHGAPFGGVALELKEPNASPSAVSKPQREWLEMFRRRGWLGRACFGADEAQSWLESVGYGRRG